MDLYKNLAKGIVGAFMIKVVLDIIFNLLHRSYMPFKSLIDFVPALLIGGLISLILFFWKDKNSTDKPGLAYFWKRFMLIICIVFPLRWSLISYEATEYFNPERSLFTIYGYIYANHELIILLIIFIAVMSDYLVILYRYQQEKVKYSLAEIEAYKKQQAEYRFGMLQAQVDPHFLFNSLNTLASLVHTDAEAASQFVRRLSGVYRNVLQHSKEDLHSLKEELKLLEDCCGLITIRFKDRVQFNFNIDSADLNKKIAPLTLQLLIENAVKHNVISAHEPLVVDLNSFDGYLVVSNVIRLKPLWIPSPFLELADPTWFPTMRFYKPINTSMAG